MIQVLENKHPTLLIIFLYKPTFFIDLSIKYPSLMNNVSFDSYIF